MSSARLVFYVLDPFTNDRRPVAALVSDAGRVRLIRAPAVGLPARAQATADRALCDIEAEPEFDRLPVGAGPQMVIGEPLLLPPSVVDASAWVRAALLPPAA